MCGERILDCKFFPQFNSLVSVNSAVMVRGFVGGGWRGEERFMERPEAKVREREMRRNCDGGHPGTSILGQRRFGFFPNDSCWPLA